MNTEPQVDEIYNFIPENADDAENSDNGFTIYQTINPDQTRTFTMNEFDREGSIVNTWTNNSFKLIIKALAENLKDNICYYEDF